jgi:hypothetical protein
MHSEEIAQIFPSIEEERGTGGDTREIIWDKDVFSGLNNGSHLSTVERTNRLGWKLKWPVL